METGKWLYDAVPDELGMYLRITAGNTIARHWVIQYPSDTEKRITWGADGSDLRPIDSLPTSHPWWWLKLPPIPKEAMQ